MYLADSISFKPSKTQRIFPNKKTTFLITFSPKSVNVQTLEYFTIFSTNDDIEIMDKIDEERENNDEIVQNVTVCVQGSCYGNTLLQLSNKSLKTVIPVLTTYIVIL